MQELKSLVLISTFYDKIFVVKSEEIRCKIHANTNLLVAGSNYFTFTEYHLLINIQPMSSMSYT